MARILSPWYWLRRAARFPGREREAVLQAVKMALAAVLAWLVARVVVPSPQSFMAPYAAVFLMTTTVYRSLTNAAQQTAALLLGLALAYAAAHLIRQPALALAAAVFVGMLLGQWHRFGGSGIWVGVTALLMISYGTAGNLLYLAERMAESLLGAAIGVGVNTVVLPPVHLRHTRDAVTALAAEVRDLLQSLAGDLREDWDADTAARWLRHARRLDSTVVRADDAVSWGRESVRFNIRWLVHRRRGRLPLPSAFESPLSVLKEVSEQVKRITEALVTAAQQDEADPEFTAEYARLLDQLAGAVACLDQDDDRLADLPGYLDELAAHHRELDGRLRFDRVTTVMRQAEDAALLAVARSARVLETAAPS
ncbi:FUSC family protein [Amycolatopsis methanolica]|uniref:Integral membrane protein n=1 Tax=Amycolatopsis methanolica 239 TaxID=1068978 RepID=A0A076N6V4_AMYME|nr:FUSC family protein [Amycolatopsis methanolica]AIJ25707.1 integral membrane protein [Amycolatopsis methanolica 239]